MWFHLDKVHVSVRTLNQLAADEGSNLPTGAKTVKEELYVDNVISGADTYEELLEIQDQTTKLLSRGGLTILKWASK